MVNFERLDMLQRAAEKGMLQGSQIVIFDAHEADNGCLFVFGHLAMETSQNATATGTALTGGGLVVHRACHCAGVLSLAARVSQMG
jgi:hypothetical protein